MKFSSRIAFGDSLSIRGDDWCEGASLGHSEVRLDIVEVIQTAGNLEECKLANIDRLRWH